MASGEKLRVLVVEDSENDALLLLRELGRAGFDPTHCRVESAAALDAALHEGAWDIVLSDYQMPQFTALDALRIVHERDEDLPVIIVSGTIGEDVAVEAMKAGAQDYLLKGSLTRLGGAVRRELHDASIRRAHRENLTKLDHLNRVLKGVRNVNQLITRERDPQALLQKACELLVESRGYHTSCMMLCDGERVLASAIAGASVGLPSLRRMVAGNQLPECVKHALVRPGVSVRQDPVNTCASCPVSRDYGRELDVAALRLESEGETFGALLVSLPLGMAADPEELDLLREVAGDVAFALRSIEHEAASRRAERELARSRETLHTVFEGARDGILAAEVASRRFVVVNEAMCRMIGYSREEILRLHQNEIHPPESLARVVELFERQMRGEISLAEDIPVLRRDGQVFPADVNATPVVLDGRPCVIGVFRDITSRKGAEEALRKNEEKYRLLVENARDVVLEISLDGLVTYCSPVITAFGGYDAGEETGQPIGKYFADPLHLGKIAASLLRVVELREPQSAEFLFRARNREPFWVEVVGNPSIENNQVTAVHCIMQDITERKLAEAQREKLEEQIRGAQKMEAIGSLAGGVAHDFNNLLSVILSYTGFAMEGVRDGDPLKNDLLEVKKAGERAAALTRQLLAFSRKQVLQSVALSLNQSATGVEKMLQRILGEDIDLVQTLAPDLGLTMADPGQIEQVIMNLVVNARDAMPEGGKLTIETSNVEIDEEYAARHVAVKPGSYVQLAVSDTGCGMDEQTRARIFEPFFTTKEKGKGTGLGMSTVYGIVKQSGGNIRVYSELGQGTTFKVYLPRELSATTPTDIKPVTITTRSKGTETILVVEDEEALRKVALRTLGASGYKVLTASDGDEALLVSAQHEGDIHMLLTDVVMPKTSGRVLAQQLSKARPTVKVLYMSGYTDNAIVHHGVLDAGTHFLAKPFTSADLARKVREVLDEGISSLADGQEHAATEVAEVKEEQPLDKAALRLLAPGDGHGSR